MNNETSTPLDPEVELFEKEPFSKRIMYVLITDQNLHNRGTLPLLKMAFFWMVVGAILGYMLFGERSLGATAGFLLALMFGDRTSDEVFSVIDGLQSIPVDQKSGFERQVVDLVKSESVEGLRNYVKEPRQCSKLINFLKDNMQIRRRYLLGDMSFIFPVVLAACLCFDVFIKSHYIKV